MRWIGQRVTDRLDRCGLGQRSLLPLLALLILLHFAYSVTPDLPPALRNLAFLAGSVLLAAVLAAASFFWPPGMIREPPAAPGVDAKLSDALLAVVMIASAAYFSLPNRLAAPLVATFGAIQVVVLPMRRPRLSLIVSCLSLLLGLGLAVWWIPLDRLGGDMLPVTVWADKVFLHGMNPYFADHSSITPNPFFYLPLQWLIYVPFVAFHLDPRLLNEIAIVGTISIYLRLWREISFPWTGFAVLLGLIAMRSSTEMLYDGEVWPLWWMISLFAFLIHRRRLRVAALVLGLLLACSQISLAIAALFGVYQIRSTASWRDTVLLAGHGPVGGHLVRRLSRIRSSLRARAGWIRRGILHCHSPSRRSHKRKTSPQFDHPSLAGQSALTGRADRIAGMATGRDGDCGHGGSGRPTQHHPSPVPDGVRPDLSLGDQPQYAGMEVLLCSRPAPAVLGNLCAAA